MVLMAKTPAQRAAKHGDRATGAPAAGSAQPINPTTRRTPAKAQSNARMVLIAGAVISLALFAYLHLYSLEQMTQLSDGLAMPDSRMGGYSAADIEALRAVMNEDDRGQLSFIHKTAGTLFPLIFAATWLLLISTQVASRMWRWLLWAPVVLFAVVDITENVVIDSMVGAATLDPGTVAAASALTVARWILLGLSLVAALVAVFLPRPKPETGSQAHINN